MSSVRVYHHISHEALTVTVNADKKKETTKRVNTEFNTSSLQNDNVIFTLSGVSLVYYVFC